MGVVVLELTSAMVDGCSFFLELTSAMGDGSGFAGPE